MDLQKIRADFPILSREVYGKPLVYFDNGATTQKPRQVVDAITDEYYSVNANVHRGVHFLSQQATELHEASRETVRKFIHAGSTNEIIFTRGTTESINLFVSSFGEEFMQEGDEVILSVMEHHSNIVPWQLLAAKRGIAIKVIPMNDRGELLLDEYKQLFSERTKIVSVAHVSNVLGTVNPVKEMIRYAHGQGVPVLVDGAQSIPHMPVDVQDLDADFYVFSGHKVYAIIMNITEEEQEFLQESRIREILHKYCQFMPYEIYLNPHDEERPVYDKDGNIEKNEDGTEKKRIVKPLPINDIHPLWLKAPKDCTDEDYKAFYQKVFMDFNEPLFWIHLNVDYPFNLKGILYFPKQLNRMEVMPGQVKLYSNQVFVADNIKEIIPEFLLLLKGVIDCPDMPLNVSRSFLQNDGEVQKIAQHITKKVSDKLHQIFKNDRPSYEKYWNDISAFIKFGCLKDEKFYDRMKDILLFKTIDGEYKTLEEYPKAEGNKIYYVTDENLQAQYISMFKENGLTAAVLTHAIDPHFISLLEYKNPEEMKFLRIDADLGEALKVSQPEAESEDAKKAQEEENNKLIECVKACLPDEKLEYKVESLKATETPAVILLSEYARRIQDMNKVLGESFAPEGQVTLVLNSENEIVKKIPSLTEENRKLVCEHIYDLALMAHKPLSAEQMSKFIARNVKLLELLAE